MERGFGLRRYVLALRKKKLIILLVMMISFLIGLFFNYDAKDDEYKAQASVYSSEFGAYVNSENEKYLVRDYSDIIKSKKIADRAALLINSKQLSGNKIKSMISYSYNEKSPVYYIYATSNDKKVSKVVANAVAKAFEIEMNSLLGKDKVKILDSAYTSEKVFDGKKEQVFNIGIITIIGMFISIIIIIINSCISCKVETVSDATLNGKIEILGVIPNFDVD